MKTNFLGPFLLWLQGRGAPVEAWLSERQIDLATVGAREFHLPHPVYCELLSRAEAETREPALGLTFAQSTVRVYAFMEAMWQNCPNVDAVLQTWNYYDKAMAGRMSFALVEKDGTVAVRQTCESFDLALERISNDFLIGWFLSQIRTLTGVPVIPMELAFAHPRPRDLEPYERFFGTANIHFEAGENRLTFDDRVRTLPIGLADPRVYDALTSQLVTTSPSSPPSPRSLIERLHETIENGLSRGAPQIEDVAKELGVSVRTLQRRISEHNSSFLREIERVRELAARQYVKQGGLSFGEIAARLGYADTSAFNRAFKRWTGRTPTEFRAQPDA